MMSSCMTGVKLCIYADPSWNRVCIKIKEIQDTCTEIKRILYIFPLNPVALTVTKPQQCLSPLTCKKTALKLKPAEYQLYPPGDTSYKQKEK